MNITGVGIFGHTSYGSGSEVSFSLSGTFSADMEFVYSTNSGATWQTIWSGSSAITDSRRIDTKVGGSFIAAWKCDTYRSGTVVATQSLGGDADITASLAALGFGQTIISAQNVDISAAVINAISAMGSAGGRINLLPGTFLLTNQILIPSNVELVGAGIRETVLITASDIHVRYAANKSSPLCMAGASKAAVRNLTLDMRTNSSIGNGITMVAASGFSGAVCDQCEITDCEVITTDQQNYLIWNYCATNSRILRNRVDGGCTTDHHGVSSTTTYDQQGIEQYGGSAEIAFNRIYNIANVALLVQSIDNSAINSANCNSWVHHNFVSNAAQFVQWITNYNTTLTAVENLNNIDIHDNLGEGIYIYGLYGNHVGTATGVIAEGVNVHHNIFSMANTNYPTLPSGATSVTPISRIQAEIIIVNSMSTASFLSCRNYRVTDNQATRWQPQAGGVATKPAWIITSMSGFDFSRNIHQGIAANQVAGTSSVGANFVACTDFTADNNILDGILSFGVQFASACTNFSCNGWKIWNWNLGAGGANGVLLNDSSKYSLTGFNFKTSVAPNGTIINLGSSTYFYVQNNSFPYQSNANNMYDLGGLAATHHGNIGTFTLAAATTWSITASQITPQSTVVVYPTTGTGAILTRVPGFGSCTGTCAVATGIYQYCISQ